MKTDGLESLLFTGTPREQGYYEHTPGRLFGGKEEVRDQIIRICAEEGEEGKQPSVLIAEALAPSPFDVNEVFRDHGLPEWMPEWMDNEFRIYANPELAWSQLEEAFQTLKVGANLNRVRDAITAIRLGNINVDSDERVMLEGLCAEMADAILNEDVEDQRRVAREADVAKQFLTYPEDESVCDLITASAFERDNQAKLAKLARQHTSSFKELRGLAVPSAYLTP